MTVQNGNDDFVTADDALARLMEGHERLLRGEPLYLDTGQTENSVIAKIEGFVACKLLGEEVRPL